MEWVRYLIYFFGIIMYVSLLGNNIWGDEAYTLGVVNNTFKDIIKITSEDVHPPLYYILLKIFLTFFHNKLLWSKIFSILPYLVVLVNGTILVKRTLGEKIATLFALFFVCSPFLLRYAVEIRMYSLAACFVFFSAISAYDFFVNYNYANCIKLSIYSLCAMYTHYFALISIMIIYGILLLCIIKSKRNVYKYVLSVFILFIGYMPWIKIFILQAKDVSNDFWIPQITGFSLIKMIYTVIAGEFSNNILAYFVFIIISILVICCVYQEKNNFKALFCLLVPLGTFLIGIFLSIVIQPIFIIKYLIPCFPLYVLFLAIICGKQKKMKSTLIICCMIILFFGNFFTFYRRVHSPENQLVDTHFIQKYSSYDGYIIDKFANDQFALVLSWYIQDKVVYTRASEQGNPYNHKNIKEFFQNKKGDYVLITGMDNPVSIKGYHCEYKESIPSQRPIARVFIVSK